MNDQSSHVFTTNEQRRRFWQSHFEDWKQSGLSQAKYCRQNRLKNRIFTYWKLKLSSHESPVEFVQVCAESIPLTPSVPGFNNSGAPLRLIVNCGFAIDIPDGFSPATLQKVLQTLQEV